MSRRKTITLARSAQDLLAERAGVERHRARHLKLAEREVETAAGTATVTIHENESPLAWLASRKGRDGRALIEPTQLQAGERLRAEFTRAQMMPRVTSNWSAAVATSPRGASPLTFTETVVAARRCVRNALDAVGPEFAGLLVDVCCFLKPVPDIERDRGWPARSGKVVLQLALDRLARHYGLGIVARGPRRGEIATWLADDAKFVVALQHGDAKPG